MFAGTYTLTKQNSRLSDLVKAAGGPNNIAYIKGARLERKTNDAERKRMEDALKMAREQQQKNMIELAARSQNSTSVSQVMQQNKSEALARFNIPATYPVGIELDKALAKPGGNEDIILREGDRLIVPQYNGTVKINGAVMYANTVGYVKGKGVKYYIDQAGGFSRDARKRDTYILYMNGMVARVGHNAKVVPGCEIIVPEKAQSKMSVAERLAVGTGVTSIATMIATMANILK
jgi:protein involved in polysaccharide export with SLBB domain